MNTLLTRTNTVEMELSAIKEEMKDDLSPAEKEYLLNRCVELALETASIALEKMKRGDVT